jgi:hypothetical protein
LCSVELALVEVGGLVAGTGFHQNDLQTSPRELSGGDAASGALSDDTCIGVHRDGRRRG